MLCDAGSFVSGLVVCKLGIIWFVGWISYLLGRTMWVGLLVAVLRVGMSGVVSKELFVFINKENVCLGMLCVVLKSRGGVPALASLCVYGFGVILRLFVGLWVCSNRVSSVSRGRISGGIIAFVLFCWMRILQISRYVTEPMFH